ncbi:MAG: MerR family transcriptional regulator [Chloroflexi bacterium]|nr:MerR family transcriptional regulator [Chloroflexota bacterium]
MADVPRPDQPIYAISVVSRLVELHPQTLRRYEELGLVMPARRSGRRLYSQRDVDRLLQIVRLTDELGINLAAVEVILRLREMVFALQAENESIRAEMEAVTARVIRSTDARQEPRGAAAPD